MMFYLRRDKQPKDRIATLFLTVVAITSYIATLFIGDSNTVSMYFVPWHFVLLPIVATSSIIYLLVRLAINKSMKFDLLNILTLLTACMILLNAIYCPIPTFVLYFR